MTEPKPPSPCCVPGKHRAAILTESRRTTAERIRATSGSTEGMIPLDGGPFLMGSESAASFPADGEGPVREVTVAPFYLDRHAVTKDQFREFVRMTGYVTEAERFGWSFVFIGQIAPEERGRRISGQVHGADWWSRVEGAHWTNPEGPGSAIAERLDHPVTHVSWNDAAAYSQWAGKRLPTEAEWEFAARGGLRQKQYPWGDELTPDGHHLCNIWQGEFPVINTAEDGYAFTAPVDAYQPNGFGFHNMSGNVWEWCGDWFDPSFHIFATRVNPAGPANGVQKVNRGGSFLCHASYCNRYRVAARTANTPDSSASHLGFRCARDV